MEALRRTTTPTHDDRVFLHGASWAQYVMVLEMRGDRSSPRVTYHRGVLELMSPSRWHDGIKTTLARLIEAWAETRDVPIFGVGSWTLKDEAKNLGLEPDECYVGGRMTDDVLRPDLAVEVVWTHGGIDKLAIYAELGVPEVWFWRDEAIEVHLLDGGSYHRAEGSRLLSGIDLALLAELSVTDDQHAALKRWRASL